MKNAGSEGAAADREELLSILGLENFLAISGIEISQRVGVAPEKLAEVLARNGIDISQVDVRELTEVIEQYRK